MENNQVFGSSDSTAELLDSDVSSSESCPACKSRHVDAREVGKGTGAFLGTVAGVVSGVCGALLSGAADDDGASTAVGSGLHWLGVASSAVLGGISGGVAGCSVGSSLGAAVDGRILSNRCCRDCGHRFFMPAF